MRFWMCQRMKVRGRSWVAPPEVCWLSWHHCQQPWGWALGLGELPGHTGVSQRGGGEPTSLRGWLPLAKVLPCAVRGGDTWTSLWPHTPRTVCREPLGTWSTPPCSLGQYQLPARLQLVCSCSLPLRPHFCLFLLCRHCSCHSNGYETRLPPQLNGPFHPMATNHLHATSIC